MSVPMIPLTHHAARQLIGEIFVNEMPFNRALGMQLKTMQEGFAELTFVNKDNLVGNPAQRILHGGVIASVIDVAAGLVCVGSALIRKDRPEQPLIEAEMRQRLATIGTINLQIDYLRPGRGERFTATSSLVRAGNKVSVARVDLHNDSGIHIATANATYLVG